jgi:alkanesulfonate monooxygenase SsuD/methylene tetrahydromethanopterin reductase-like flavin-dependent oxidoreductase (luciferase family)
MRASRSSGLDDRTEAPMTNLKLGALCWSQYTEWPVLLEAGLRAERVGYDTLWTWDHLYPIVGDPHGPNYEGWLTITAWAARTKRVRIGLMVGANPYREPSLVAKMATTLDHISDGRAILGIGAAWFEGEAHDFGFEFGSGPGERLRWLGDALPIMRGMLDGTEPSGRADGRYRASQVRNDPQPVQRHLPICIGGGGEKVTLRLVARYADMNNVGGGIESVRRKEAILRRHCEEVGRDPVEIERTAGIGTVVIRDDPAEAERVGRAAFDRNRVARPWTDQPHGTPEQVAEKLAPYLELGYFHLISGFPAPYDEESMTRFVTEVKPMLARSVGQAAGQAVASGA